MVVDSDFGKEELITADPVGVIALTHRFLSGTCSRSAAAESGRRSSPDCGAEARMGRARVPRTCAKRVIFFLIDGLPTGLVGPRWSRVWTVARRHQL